MPPPVSTAASGPTQQSRCGGEGKRWIMKTLTTTAALFAACMASTSAHAQISAAYNRSIRAVAITPSSTNPNEHVATVVFTVEIRPLPTDPAPEGGTTNVNVGTNLLVMHNGTPIAAVPFDISVDPLSLTPCGGSCGQGATNGMAAALLCIDGICQFPPIAAPIPIPNLDPSDFIEVILVPATGSVPDSNTADNARFVPYNGSSIGWNRAVRNVSMQPSSPSATEGAGGDSFFDVFFDIEYSSFGIQHQLFLGAQPMLLINGSPVNPNVVGCNDWIASPNSECTITCDADCGTSNCGGQQSDLDCRLTENDYNQQFCACLGESSFFIPAVPLQPGDEIVVILRPVPGALPELPGFGDDDEGEGPADCELCPGDLNGDGIVNGADLATLLANWGICFPV